MVKKAAKEPLCVASKVKAFVKSQELMMASETLEAVNESVYSLLARAAERAKANGRKTLRPQDL